MKWTAGDKKQIREQGSSTEEVERQIRLFASPPPAPVLDRPATVGDGIRKLTPSEVKSYAAKGKRAQARGRHMKFVPASGAASRMFQSLLALKQRGVPLTRSSVAQAAATDADAKQALVFIDYWDRFAFSAALRDAMRKRGLDANALAARGEFGPIIHHLLDPEGLGYAHLPKALILFHQEGNEARAALEEHWVEAAAYVADKTGRARLHVTVSPEHLKRIRALAAERLPVWQKRLKVRFAIGFSTQPPSTNTIAVTPDNKPFRTKDGRLLFRPGGHGALIKNLGRLKGDIVLIKNIDNVAPDHLKAPTILWKLVLAGLLADLQQQAAGWLARLEKDASPSTLRQAEAFLKQAFGRTLHAADKPAARKKALIAALDRPIRLCGVVKNSGEPGGGPFWVQDAGGGQSLQIIESAQVAHEAQQKAVFQAGTHFNPVDLVCSVRDAQGAPFTLSEYVDEEAVFIACKSQDGRELTVLERPGLWNGAMAYWNTVFVEVPLATFNPVKTLLDLLRPAHQA